MYLKTQSFLVAGLSKSGKAAAEFLLSRGARVFISDDVKNETVEKNIKELSSAGAIFFDTEQFDRMISECDILVLSPGIPIDHPLPIAFRKAGKRIIGEAELGCLFLKTPSVAVTGTNGKTTVVTMIDRIFQESGKHSVACGNIGLPITACVDRVSETEIAVMEISSFQLETLSSICPHVAVVTNIGEDHLNRHYTMENYIYLKSKLLRNLRESEYAVLNADDSRVKPMAESAHCPIYWFSVRECVNGAYLQQGDLFFCKERIMASSELLLKGEHNIQNALAAICVAKSFGIENETIAAALRKMRGVRHRIQTVCEIGGVAYVNDSKGTNCDATLRAVNCMDRDTLLLLGGKDKGYNYDELFQKLQKSHVIQYILYGENRFKILESALRVKETRLLLCMNFEQAVRIASLTAESGQCVLLSPASSSFDEFSGYEERGERFEELVSEFKQNSEDAIDAGGGD